MAKYLPILVWVGVILMTGKRDHNNAWTVIALGGAAIAAVLIAVGSNQANFSNWAITAVWEGGTLTIIVGLLLYGGFSGWLTAALYGVAVLSVIGASFVVIVNYDHASPPPLPRNGSTIRTTFVADARDAIKKFEGGICTSHSRSDVNRSDAFHCSPTGTARLGYGPCFAVVRFYSTDRLECYLTPWDSVVTNGQRGPLADATFSSVVYRVRGGLRGDPHAWDKPWALRLVSGARCRYTRNIRSFIDAGDPPGTYYQCRKPVRVGLWEMGKVVGWIIGDFPDPSAKPKWSVQFVRPRHSGTQTVAVAEVWK